jgi:hypothetical protein
VKVFLAWTDGQSEISAFASQSIDLQPPQTARIGNPYSFHFLRHSSKEKGNKHIETGEKYPFFITFGDYLSLLVCDSKWKSEWNP